MYDRSGGGVVPWSFDHGPRMMSFETEGAPEGVGVLMVVVVVVICGGGVKAEQNTSDSVIARDVV